jgi:acetyl-CoA carboxylase beta subunit
VMRASAVPLVVAVEFGFMEGSRDRSWASASCAAFASPTRIVSPPAAARRCGMQEGVFAVQMAKTAAVLQELTKRVALHRYHRSDHGRRVSELRYDRRRRLAR